VTPSAIAGIDVPCEAFLTRREYLITSSPKGHLNRRVLGPLLPVFMRETLYKETEYGKREEAYT